MKRLLLLFTLFISLLSINIKADTVYVSVMNDFFDPANFTVNVGDQVKWTLMAGSHTTTSNLIPTGASPWNYTFTGIGDTYVYEVTVPGIYNYECIFHPGMIGAFTAVNSLPFIEEFDYPVGNLLTDNGWTNHSGAGNFIMIASGSLTYSGYPSSGVGNHVVIEGGAGSREDVNSGLEEQSGNGTTVYYSLLANVASASATADYFIHLGDRVSPTAFTLFAARIYVQDEAGNLKFGLSNTSTVTMGTTNFSYATTYLLMVKYTIDTGGADECKLWVLSTGVPPDEVSAGTPEVTNSSTNGQDIIDAVALRQGGQAYSVQVDGIRIANTWNEIVIPVELVSFNASVSGSSVSLNWITASEINNSGFEIERKSSSISWTKIGFVQGYGTTAETKSYSFADNNLQAGKYSYRLKQIDYDGSYEYSNVVEADVIPPQEFSLFQNYPNPFNPATTISYSLPSAGFVSLKIYNALGQEVAALVNGVKEAGNHKVEFSAANLNSGIYFYKIETGSFSQVKKMTLIK